MHNTSYRGTGFENYFTDVVRNVSDFHSLRDIRATFDRRIEDARLLTRQRYDLSIQTGRSTVAGWPGNIFK